MRLEAYLLTKKITADVMDRANREGMAENDSCRVEQVPFLRGIFRGVAIFGLVLALLALFVGHEPVVAVLLLLVSGGLSVPMLISYHTCWITYDDSGFTQSGFFGTKHRYSYEDVTGLAKTDTRVEIEVCGNKRITLEETWINRQGLARAIVKNRSKRPPKIKPSVTGMSEGEIEASYQNGVLKKALLVPEKGEYRSRLLRFKCIHYGICTLSCVLAACSFLFLSLVGMGCTAALLCVAFPSELLVLAAVVLYFRYPDYFTAREKPSACDLDKSSRKYHKLCTLAPVSTLSMCSSVVLLLDCAKSAADGVNYPLSVGTAIAAAVLLFGTMMVLFRRFSWEYRTFRIGCVSYCAWQVCGCLSLFMLICGLLIR